MILVVERYLIEDNDHSQLSQSLSDSNERSDDSNDPIGLGLADGSIQIVASHKHVQNVAHELNGQLLQQKLSLLHINQLSLVLPVQEDHHQLHDALQRTENALQSVHPHAAGVVGVPLLFADHFQLAQVHPVVAQIEQHCEEVFQDDQKFENEAFGIA